MKRENLKTLENQLEELENLVFNSETVTETIKGAVNYRIKIWKEKMKKLPAFTGLWNNKSIEDLHERAEYILCILDAKQNE